MQEAGQGGIDAVVNTLDIHVKDPVPVRLLHGLHKPIEANARIADENIHIADLPEGGLHGGAVGHIAADRGGAGFSGNVRSGSVVLLIEEEHPVALLREELHRRPADPPGPAGDHNC